MDASYKGYLLFIKFLNNYHIRTYHPNFILATYLDEINFRTQYYTSEKILGAHPEQRPRISVRITFVTSKILRYFYHRACNKVISVSIPVSNSREDALWRTEFIQRSLLAFTTSHLIRLARVLKRVFLDQRQALHWSVQRNCVAWIYAAIDTSREKQENAPLSPHIGGIEILKLGSGTLHKNIYSTKLY